VIVGDPMEVPAETRDAETVTLPPSVVTVGCGIVVTAGRNTVIEPTRTGIVVVHPMTLAIASVPRLIVGAVIAVLALTTAGIAVAPVPAMIVGVPMDTGTETTAGLTSTLV
jgi:hypothetical protein